MRDLMTRLLLVKIMLGQNLCNLTAPIRPEVETQNYVTIFDHSDWRSVGIGSNDRKDKFVGNTCFVRVFNGFKHVR